MRVQINPAQAGTVQANAAPGRPWTRAPGGGPQAAQPAFPQEFPLALPAITRAEADSINAFYRRRPALAFTVAGSAATMMPSWPPAPDDGSGRCRVDITVDGAPGALILSRSLIAALVAGLDPDQAFERLESNDLALLLELAVADTLPILEESLGCRLAIAAVRLAGDEKRGAAPLAFDLVIDGVGTSAGELLLQPRHAAKLARLMDHRAAGAVPAIDLPVPLCLRVAATVCSVGEIATLSPGDVVMADQCCRQAETAVAVLAEHLAAPVTLTAASVEIAAPAVRIRGSSWEWSMENGGDRSQANLMQKSELDDIPVKLLFEVGRIELSLAEIRRLAPGAVIAMPRAVEDGVEITANGRRIGRGSLIQIGGNLGVRITRLFDNG